MATVKPVIVIVPGAWHVAKHYQLLTSRLEDAGYEVHSLDLPTTDAATKNSEDDIVYIRQLFTQLADKGQEIVVVVHSRGGIPAGDAAEGLSVSDRAKQGKKGGIARMVYIAAFAGAEGVSIDIARGGSHDDVMTIDGAMCTPFNTHHVFYTDVSADVYEECAKDIRPVQFEIMLYQAKYAAWKHIPSTYMVCEGDQAIKLEAQEFMIGQPGASFEIERCGASHSPFVSQPDFTAEVVRRAAGEKI